LFTSAGKAQAGRQLAPVEPARQIAELKKVMDIHGSFMFLRGKLKEMTDMLGGPDVIMERRESRTEVEEVA
jgi:hypothetical protein